MCRPTASLHHHKTTYRPEPQSDPADTCGCNWAQEGSWLSALEAGEDLRGPLADLTHLFLLRFDTEWQEEKAKIKPIKLPILQIFFLHQTRSKVSLIGHLPRVHSAGTVLEFQNKVTLKSFHVQFVPGFPVLIFTFHYMTPGDLCFGNYLLILRSDINRHEL